MLSKEEIEGIWEGPHDIKEKVALSSIEELHQFITGDLHQAFHETSKREATTPDVVWTTLEGLLGKQDEIRVHQLENELISLNATHFRNLQECFTKFKSLLVELDACGVKKEEDQLILSILSKLGLEYSVFVSSFQASKLTQEKWKMPPLNDFIEAFTQEQANLFQMGAIKHSKNQALAATDAPKSSGRDKQKGKGKFNESKKERLIQSSKRSSLPKGKKKKEITHCNYCSKFFHPKENCTRKTIDEMAKQLQQHNLTVPENEKKKDDNRMRDGRGIARDGHALMDFISTPSSWILDSSASNHMAASKYEFSSIEESTRSPIYLGDATPTKNQIPHKALKGTTPFECWIGKKPKVSHFHIFGSRAWAHIPIDKRKDLEPQNVECIFVGYPNNFKGYRFLNSHTEKFLVARSVKFEEESLHDFSADPAKEPLVTTDEEFETSSSTSEKPSDKPLGLNSEDEE
eukprot:PITA_29701